MSRTWLAIDSNYLCWRAYYSTGQLEYDEIPTGVVFGFLRDVLTLQEDFATSNIVFCFDHGFSLRRKLYRDYKRSRRELTDEQASARALVHEQVKAIKTEYLKELGFRNIFYQKGYEADDCLASVVHGLRKGEDCILVSGDHDLYQLLGDRVILFNPTRKQSVDIKHFRNLYGIEPNQWHCAKAIAGCSSDDVPGIKGVGDITACKFLRGKLPQGSVIGERIEAEEATWKRNLQLVKLPYPGMRAFKPKKDAVSVASWTKLLKRLGMKSLFRYIHTGNGKTKLF